MELYRTLVLLAVVIGFVPKQLLPSRPETTYKSYPLTNLSFVEYLPSLACEFSTKCKNFVPVKQTMNLNATTSLLLILLGGDVACNPGPRSPKYPCMTCKKAVKWNVQAICCDSCDQWCHTSCLTMSPHVYQALEDHPSFSWICCDCGMPNFASSLFNTTTINLSNSFAPLSDSFDSIDSSIPFSPQCTSSPIGKGKRQDKKKQPPKPALRTLIINARSVRGKVDQLHCEIELTDPDIVAITETWLDPTVLSSELFPPNFTVYRRDRPSTTMGGGVLLAVNNRLLSSRAEELETSCEILWIKIEMVKVKSLYVGVFYRPPTSSALEANKTLEELETSILRIQNSNANIWLCGDFNMPDIDWETGSARKGAGRPEFCRKLIGITQDASLEQQNLQPTRGQNILDLFLTNNPTLTQQVKVIPGLSDHDSVLVDSLLCPLSPRKASRKVYLHKKADFQSFISDLEDFKVKFLENTEPRSVNSMWSEYLETMLSLRDKYVPSKVFSGKQKHPWVTNQIRRLLRRKERAYHQARKTHKDADWHKFRQLKKTAQKLFRQAYWTYVNNIVDPPEKQPNNKGFWSYLKKFKSDNVGISVLKKNGQTAISPEDKARMLNEQFCSVFTDEDISNIPTPPDVANSTVGPLNIDAAGIAKILKNLNPNKAAGPDGLTTRLLKETYSQSAEILQKIFQKSILEGTLPDDWKRASISPVYKKESRCLPSNYRPVSLTSVACKVLEHIVSHHLMGYFDENNILVDHQHGFRSRRSCETQLILTYQDLAQTTDKRGQVDMLVLDFAKAFDTVPHQRLLKKLAAYGVTGNLHKWIASFLIGRTQCVNVDGTTSETAPVRSGVPQGTVLGPLLFLVYINDLAGEVSSSVRLFADDCVMYRPVVSEADCEMLQADLHALHRWENKWLMSFNTKKCHVVRVTHARSHKVTFDYKLGNNTLTALPSHGYLGVEISEDLKWNTHINHTVSKANRTLGVVRRNLKQCPRDIKAKAYSSIVRPKLEYAASVWDPFTDTNVNALEAVQRRAARFVCNTYSRDASVTSLLTQLQWPSLAQRRAQSRLAMLHRILNGTVDIACDSLVARPAKPSRFGHSKQLERIQCSKDCYKYSFIPRTVVQWNNLPQDVVDLNELIPFKESIKTIDLTLDGTMYRY